MSRLVVVSNRVPLGEGKTPAGGLAVGVMDALQQSGGMWFGWNGQTDCDDEGVDIGRHGAITVARTGLSQQDYQQYYLGFSNGMLWPTFHYRVDLAQFERDEYAGYRRVNTRLAQRLKPLLKPDDTLWVHDYHLIPFAHACRELGIENRIGFFLHIPFPVAEVTTTIPAHRELLGTLCDYDLLGFQTEDDRQAFLRYVRQEDLASVMPDEGGLLARRGRRTHTGVYPIGVNVQEIADIAQQRVAHHASGAGEIGDAPWQTILSADRLDYTKGLLERFAAFESLLEQHPEHHRRVRFVQIAPASRSDLYSYQLIRKQLEECSGHINGRFADLDWVPVNYINRNYDRNVLMGMYRQSRVGFVTPLRDGMNLVAKEFVAAQDPENPGVLVLSRFAGAAHELDAALLVNPFDTTGVANALHRALTMPRAERCERHAALLQAIREADIVTWRKRFLADLHNTQALPRLSLAG